MDPAILASLAREAISFATRLTMNAVSAGAMTQADADAALAVAQQNWADAYRGWKDRDRA